MTNKKEEVVRDAEVVSTESGVWSGRREKEARAAKKIEEVLVGEGLALQPYISYSEYGVIPRVRLVEHNPTINDEGASEEQAETAGDADESTEPVTP